VDEERIMCQDWPTTARATLLISILQLNNRLRDFLDIYFYLILFLSFLLKVFLCLGRLNSPRIGSCICKSRSIWIIWSIDNACMGGAYFATFGCQLISSQAVFGRAPPEEPKPFRKNTFENSSKLLSIEKNNFKGSLLLNRLAELLQKSQSQSRALSNMALIGRGTFVYSKLRNFSYTWWYGWVFFLVFLGLHTDRVIGK
jgi:hypothetical protein